MNRRNFTIRGNICGERVKVGRALQRPSMTQEDLARKLQFMGVEDMTAIIISRIEKNQRHVCDYELMMIAEALGVSMRWLVGRTDNMSAE